MLFYTSGTTGRPKGAVLTHFNLVMNAFTNAFTANHIVPDDVMFGCLPLFHTFGQTVALNGTFLVGGTLILQPRFEPAEALALMVEHGVTAFLGVPTMYMALLAARRRRTTAAPLPRLRLCVSGGAPLPVTVLEEFNDHLRRRRSRRATACRRPPPPRRSTSWSSASSPGRSATRSGASRWRSPTPTSTTRIVLKPVGEVGEIVIRGHNVFAGYHERPDATAAAIVDGWFRSGDLGTKDERGFLRIVDRKKDLILRGGYNVYPREVEEVLVRHPAVDQVAVVGVPHETHGEEVLAVIVLRERAGADADADALLAWAGERVARHKRPRLVRFVDELPLGPSRKVLKRELRDRFAAGATLPEPVAPAAAQDALELLQRRVQVGDERPRVGDLALVGDDPEVEVVAVAHHGHVEADAVDHRPTRGTSPPAWRPRRTAARAGPGRWRSRGSAAAACGSAGRSSCARRARRRRAG